MHFLEFEFLLLQVCNVLPASLYVLASLLGLVAHFTAYAGAVYGTEYVDQNITETIYVYDKFLRIHSAECFSNLFYSPALFPPPCNNPLLFNSSCLFHNTVCYSEDLNPVGECAASNIEKVCNFLGVLT